MTVKEFITILEKMDPEAIVFVRYEEDVWYSDLTSGMETQYKELLPEAVFQIEPSEGPKNLIIAADLIGG